MPYEWGYLPVPPVMPQHSPEALARIEASKAKRRRARKVWDSLRDDVTFDQWISMGDEALVERAVNKAWDLFVEELAQLAESRWEALVTVEAWFNLPVLDRQAIVQGSGGTARILTDTVVLSGCGIMPELVKAMAR